MIYAWGAFVQMLADNDREHSVEITEGAGFKVKHAPPFRKQYLVVKKGDSANTARLIAKAVAKRASYDWQWSKDGVNRVNFESSTRKANNTIGGLTPAVIYYFRVRGNPDETGQWTGPVAFIAAGFFLFYAQNFFLFCQVADYVAIMEITTVTISKLIVTISKPIVTISKPIVTISKPIVNQGKLIVTIGKPIVNQGKTNCYNQ